MCILSFFYLKNSIIPLIYNMVSVALFLDFSSVSCHLFKNSAFHRLLRTCLCFILRSFIMPPRAIPVVTHLSNVNADSVSYVYPSEGPNSISITPQLNGSNYLSWPRLMQQDLGEKTNLISSMVQFLFLRLLILIVLFRSDAIILSILGFKILLMLQLPTPLCS